MRQANRPVSCASSVRFRLLNRILSPTVRQNAPLASSLRQMESIVQPDATLEAMRAMITLLALPVHQDRGQVRLVRYHPGRVFRAMLGGSRQEARRLACRVNLPIILTRGAPLVWSVQHLHDTRLPGLQFWNVIAAVHLQLILLTIRLDAGPVQAASSATPLVDTNAPSAAQVRRRAATRRAAHHATMASFPRMELVIRVNSASMHPFLSMVHALNAEQDFTPERKTARRRAQPAALAMQPA